MFTFIRSTLHQAIPQQTFTRVTTTRAQETRPCDVFSGPGVDDERVRRRREVRTKSTGDEGRRVAEDDRAVRTTRC